MTRAEITVGEYMELMEILKQTLALGGSDIFIVPGSQVKVKVRGQMQPVGTDRMTCDQTEKLIRQTYELARGRSMDKLLEEGDDDFSFAIPGVSRYRVSTFKQRGSYSAVIRVIAFTLPEPSELHIPDAVMELANTNNGMVLVTGPAGSGKSTTINCLLSLLEYDKGTIEIFGKEMKPTPKTAA